MPSYEYLCEVVNEEFEAEHSIKIVLDECLLCKTAGRSPHVPKRFISGGSGKGIVEKSFNEMKESFASDVAKMRKDVLGSEKKLANVIGESKYHNNELSRTRR